MADVLSRRALNRAFLGRQMLLDRAPLDVAEAVSALAGLQAQWPRSPYVALWSRLKGFRREALDAAISRRALVRATLMRGTLHLVTADDYRLFRPLLRPVLEAAARGIAKNRKQDFDLAAVAETARKILKGRALTFNELRPQLVEAFPGVDDRALGYAARMFLELVMPPDASQSWGFATDPPFMLADDWLPAGKAKPAPEALVRRYLAAFGPASVADAQNWSGLRGLKPTFEALRGELVTFRDARGRELFDLPDAPRPDEAIPAPARLLPDFDQLLLGHDDRTRVIAEAHRPRIATKNLLIPATFLVDGFVAGAWTFKAGRKRLAVTLTAFETLAARERRALETEAEGLGPLLAPEAGGVEVAFAEV